jgi:uncharacterized protein YbjT (DUF2867 family)
MTPRSLFVAGATGAVGTVLLPMAAELGLAVVPHARPRSAGKLSHPRAAILELEDAQALVGAMRGCTTVLQLIGTMRKRFAVGDTYESSDIGTTRLLVQAAREAGVDHLVLLSSVGAGRPVGAYLKAKAAAEQLVRESGFDYTILRPSAFEDRDGGHMPLARAITKTLGFTKYRPISLRELASALLRVAAARAPLGVALEGDSLWPFASPARARSPGPAA